MIGSSHTQLRRQNRVYTTLTILRSIRLINKLSLSLCATGQSWCNKKCVKPQTSLTCHKLKVLFNKPILTLHQQNSQKMEVSLSTQPECLWIKEVWGRLTLQSARGMRSSLLMRNTLHLLRITPTFHANHMWWSTQSEIKLYKKKMQTRSERWLPSRKLWLLWFLSR